MADSQPTRYLFVDCPDPKKLKLDRSKGSKSHVRAHVTKEYHRRVRMERLQAYKQKDPNAPPAPPGTTATLAGEELLPIRTNNASTSGNNTELALIPTSTTPTTVAATPIQSEEKRQEQQRDAIREMGSKFINSLLSQNRTDPFDCLSIPGLPRYSQRVLDFALHNTWPETVPTGGRALDNPINKVWLQTCLDHPVLMHALLYAASLQMSLLSDGSDEGPEVEKIRFAHYSETIKQVYRHISTLQGPPPDALVLTVVALAVHGRPAKEPMVQCHPKSPLYRAQYLHIYGSMYLALEHLPAVMSLMERKGGLRGITTYGVAETLQVADIYFATLGCAKPHFSLLKVPTSYLASGKIKLDPLAAALMSELLTGFRYLVPSTSGQDLHEALNWIRESTVAVDLFHRKAPGALALYEFTPLINMTQYKTLMVNATIMPANSEETSIVCIARLAALIYNDMVIIPCPEVQQVKVRAAGFLRSALEYHFEQFDFRRHARLLLWATMMGSIGTSFTPGQVWFLRRLQWQAWELGINDWPSLQSLCTKFLWWRPVCDEPGLRIWNEMVTQVSSTMMRRASD
ncbi:hypothetical protein DV738_g1544, partial [Chaetothyriales sp. CBS 135597]